MSIVAPYSAISVLCDCPYTGKTREVTGSAENEDRRRRKLKKEIRETKDDLIIAKNVLMDTRHYIAAFQKILCLELGWVINPFIQNKPSWKDRVREEAYLKSELMHLVDYLRQDDQQFIKEPTIYPTKLSASTEDLLLSRQERQLKDLYHSYTVYTSENEKRVGASLSNFLKLRENYENKLYCNKILEQEIVLVKKKICDLQRRFLEDKCLIDYITDHPFEMKGTFLDTRTENRKFDTDMPKVEKDAEAEKYKKLWEESKMEKRRLSGSIQALRKRLDFANNRIIRSENICAGNIVSFRIFAKKLKESILLSKIQPKRKDNFGKFSFIQYRSQKSQLEAAIDENLYLRNFLRKAVLSETDNLKQLRSSLQSTAGKYRTILEDIRTELAPPPPPPPPPVETKETKKKKK